MILIGKLFNWFNQIPNQFIEFYAYNQETAVIWCQQMVLKVKFLIFQIVLILTVICYIKNGIHNLVLKAKFVLILTVLNSKFDCTMLCLPRDLLDYLRQIKPNRRSLSDRRSDANIGKCTRTLRRRFWLGHSAQVYRRKRKEILTAIPI